MSWKVKEATDSTMQGGRVPDSTWTNLADYQRSALHGTWWAATTVAITAASPPDRYFALFPDRMFYQLVVSVLLLAVWGDHPETGGELAGAAGYSGKRH